MSVQYRHSADVCDRVKGVRGCRPGEIVVAMKCPEKGEEWIQVNKDGEVLFLPLIIADKIYFQNINEIEENNQNWSSPLTKGKNENSESCPDLLHPTESNSIVNNHHHRRHQHTDSDGDGTDLLEKKKMMRTVRSEPRLVRTSVRTRGGGRSPRASSGRSPRAVTRSPKAATEGSHTEENVSENRRGQSEGRVGGGRGSPRAGKGKGGRIGNNGSFGKSNRSSSRYEQAESTDSVISSPPRAPPSSGDDITQPRSPEKGNVPKKRPAAAHSNHPRHDNHHHHKVKSPSSHRPIPPDDVVVTDQEVKSS